MFGAWSVGYHKEADGLLHSRVESFFIAQAFLVASLAYVLGEDTLPSFRQWLVPMIILLGLFVAVVITWINAQMLRGIEYLKEHHVSNDDIYLNYLAGEKTDRAKASKGLLRGGAGRCVLPIWLPMAFALFWAAASVLCARDVYGIQLHWPPS